ncbi:hypothetical protein QQZ08_010275 [Neonectria magnoliae]|uniref:LysM domain-containing protein n=1 Tax=Neonectria magnoliae TaxID=2732573 RepID=A0ABR1HIL5_9HYPO
MVDNCNRFHLVQPGEKCSTVAALNSISIPNFIKWDPAAGSGCTGLKTNTYACSSVTGYTPTKPENGITTPTPTQPEIVDNCNKFHLVKTGENCSTVANLNRISIADILKWNSRAGSGCTGLKTGLVDDYNKFYLAKTGEKCPTIANNNAISISDFLAWNPKIGTGCTSLKEELAIVQAA